MAVPDRCFSKITADVCLETKHNTKEERQVHVSMSVNLKLWNEDVDVFKEHRLILHF